ncbi:MAG: 3-phosphoshikimate 1-carboxyvinyltransferase [Verrucomicrobiota bacterium]|nr:3-phosphoshikimate 1-carboxyvinyltransferase [Verrucomicrobiota bacterium]
MTADDSRVVRPCRKIGGRVKAPGDKSVSHRAAMLGALAAGTSRLENFLLSEDCMNTLRAMRKLGASVTRDGNLVKIRGAGGMFQASPSELDMGNSGTGMRLLCGLLAGHSFVSRLTGDASLRSRPMRRIQAPLEKMGATVELLGAGGTAPARIRGGNLRGIEYAPPVASAQVKSCVLLAGLFAAGATTVIEPKPTRDHTERMLRAMGVRVAADRDAVSVEGAGSGRAPALEPLTMVVPGDFSSAAFWLAAAAAREGAEIVLEEVGLNPRRTAFLDVLRRMGADVEVRGVGMKFTPEPRAGGEENYEPVGTITVKGCALAGAEVSGEEIPNLIDELPLVAVLGALASGRTVIRDAAELRVKESDRIAAMAGALAAMGVVVEERPDGMVVNGGAVVRGGGVVETRGDHRVAMASAILALSADGPVTIRDVSFIATSYPDFWKHLEDITSVRMATP